MFVGTLRINRSLQTVFLSLTVLFVLLALAEWTGNATIGKIAGWEGIFVGLSAVYGSIAQVWNELYGTWCCPSARTRVARRSHRRGRRRPR